MSMAAAKHAMDGEVVEVLRRVRTRLTPATAWTQHNFSLALEGRPCQASAPDAVCWCLEGAVLTEATAVYLRAATFWALIETIGLHDSGLTLAGWNDAPGRTHDDVLGVLSVTITRLERTAGVAA